MYLATTEASESNRSGTEKNVALFVSSQFLTLAAADMAVTGQMPYLHWETSSRRAKMVQVVNEAITSPDGSLGNSSAQKRKGTFSSAVAQLEGKPEYVPTYKQVHGH